MSVNSMISEKSKYKKKSHSENRIARVEDPLRVPDKIADGVVKALVEAVKNQAAVVGGKTKSDLNRSLKSR